MKEKTNLVALLSVLAASIVSIGDRVSAEQLPNSEFTDSLEQVTNISELRDVSPGDWAYEALRNLVERYGCVAGYPNATFRGDRPLTRYEFAAGLNSCLNQIERLIQESQTVTIEDIEKLQRLTHYGSYIMLEDSGNGALLTPSSGTDQSRPLQVEAFYNFKISDNVSITPGAFVIFNPESDGDNSTTGVGVVRTTFSF